MLLLRGIAKILRRRFGSPLVRRADRARDAGEWIEAVVDYSRGLERMPWREDLKVQIGNCLKEFGDYRGAIRAYSAVTAGTDLFEARKQLADVNRRAGVIMLPFAVAESPDVVGPERARDGLPAVTPELLPNRIRLDPTEPRGWLGVLGRVDYPSGKRRATSNGVIKLDQVGAMVVERDGACEPLLVGVVAIRGRVSSRNELDQVTIAIGQGTIHSVVRAPLRLGAGRDLFKQYVFNVWLDASTLPHGRHWLSMKVGGKVSPTGLFVNITEPADAELFGSSNSFIVPPVYSPGELDRTVAAMPATIRPASRTLFDGPVNSILAMRADQLGDVSASLPALARLRVLFPEARLAVLAQPAVEAVIMESGLVDEVLPITLAYDTMTEQRRLDPSEEKRLRAVLAADRFDLAIDLSPGDESRPLLLLTGATYLVGFNPDHFTFLDFGIVARSRDKVNQLERLSHAAAVLMLVEALAVASTPARPIVPRTSDPQSDLEVLRAEGLEPGGHVVLHLGARHEVNRWPIERFMDLCRRLIEKTPLKVVVFADAHVKAVSALAGERVRVFGLVEPRTFDVILSSARAMVGNDSGPKHLAAARGVPTVSIHVDRLNWNEWGQDGRGVIVSKRVPCTGCGLNHIALCGRDAICVQSITSDEVFCALSPFI